MVQDFINTREFTQFLEERIEYFKRYLQKQRELVLLETEMYERSFWRFFNTPPKLSDDARVVSWRLREYQEELLRVRYQGKNGGMISPSDSKMLKIFYCWSNDKTEYTDRYLRGDV